ncbi:hypothetical protein LCGC14_2142220, partial [marine sediment metagenome]
GAASPSTVGLIRIPFNRFIYSRNSTNTNNIRILGIDTFTGTNEVWVGDRALGVGMRTESIKTVSDATIGDDLFIGTASDGWVFNNVTLPGSLVLIEMPPTSASGKEMSLLGQTIDDAEVVKTITLSNLTQVTTRNHSSLQGIAATDHHAQRLQIWRGGFYETSPSTGLTTIPLPVADQCAAGISVERVSVAAITKGSGTMTFQVTRYNSAGVSQGNIFSGNQTYSNTGDNRQDFTATTTTATANDYFRFNIVTLNGQADVSFLVEGKCNVL